jgi:predicted metal-dependent hydrolase
MDVGGTAVEVIRKDIKHLHVGVYPPDGRVRVAAPLRLDDDAVRLAVVSRLGWIRRHQAGFRGQPRQSRRELVTGESHHVEGRHYRLDVIEGAGPPAVRVMSSRSIRLQVPRGTERDRREAVLQRWYRTRLRERVGPLVAKWEAKVGVRVAAVRLRRMKTRWGSCNAEACRVWLNLELAKKPPACLEYVLVHEMVHLLERRHTPRFRELMDTLMPTWRLHREELNRAPLAHAQWRY